MEENKKKKSGVKRKEDANKKLESKTDKDKIKQDKIEKTAAEKQAKAEKLKQYKESKASKKEKSLKIFTEASAEDDLTRREKMNDIVKELAQQFCKTEDEIFDAYDRLWG